MGVRGINETDVWRAADALLLEGARPTIERVRMKIGRGSPNTVTPYLETWFRSLGAGIADPVAFSTPPATMTKIKIGRNDPCHCGSGQKYKRSCQEKDQAAERAARSVAEAAKPPTPAHHGHTSLDSFRADIDDDLEERTAASNAVIDMVHDGKLDEAERAARDLLVRFPEVHDGYDRLGMVYAARGDHKQAADYYRQVIDFVQSRPDSTNPDLRTPSRD